MNIMSAVLNAYRLTDSEYGGRYALTSCCIQREAHGDGRCRIMATDGRAAILTEWTDNIDRGPIDVIVDRKICRHAARHHNDGTLTVRDQEVTLHDSTQTISGRQLEGQFPNIPKAFPSAKNAAVVVVDAFLLRRALTAIIKSQGCDSEGKVTVAIAVDRDVSMVTSDRDPAVTLTAHNDTCNTIAALMRVEIDPSRRKGFLWRPEIDKAEGGQ